MEDREGMSDSETEGGRLVEWEARRKGSRGNGVDGVKGGVDILEKIYLENGVVVLEESTGRE